MVTANQNYDAHTKKKKQSKHNTKDNHQITREEHNRGRGRKKKKKRPSWVAKWLRICLPKQATQVRSLVWDMPQSN